MKNLNLNEEEAVQRVERFIEERFITFPGAPMAYMEMPQRDGGGPVRVVYESVVYCRVKRNPFDYDLGPLIEAMEEKMRELSDRAGPKALLYWRAYPEFHEGDDNKIYLKVRVGVLNPKTLEQVFAEPKNPALGQSFPKEVG